MVEIENLQNMFPQNHYFSLSPLLEDTDQELIVLVLGIFERWSYLANGPAYNK